MLSVNSHENYKSCCPQMSDSKAKMHLIQFRLGFGPRPCWGSLQRSPHYLPGFKGPTSKGRGGERREWKGALYFFSADLCLWILLMGLEWYCHTARQQQGTIRTEEKWCIDPQSPTFSNEDETRHGHSKSYCYSKALVWPACMLLSYFTTTEVIFASLQHTKKGDGNNQTFM